jgi:hypothetical protein
MWLSPFHLSSASLRSCETSFQTKKLDASFVNDGYSQHDAMKPLKCFSISFIMICKRFHFSQSQRVRIEASVYEVSGWCCDMTTCGLDSILPCFLSRFTCSINNTIFNSGFCRYSHGWMGSVFHLSFCTVILESLYGVPRYSTGIIAALDMRMTIDKTPRKWHLSLTCLLTYTKWLWQSDRPSSMTSLKNMKKNAVLMWNLMQEPGKPQKSVDGTLHQKRTWHCHGTLVISHHLLHGYLSYKSKILRAY